MFWKMLVMIISAILVASLLTYAISIAEMKKSERGSAENAVFTEVKMVKVGNHTYYPDTLFDLRRPKIEDKEWIIEFMKKADRDLTYDVYVTGFNSMYATDEFRMFGLKMEQGVVEPDISLNTGILPDGSVIWGSSRYGIEENFPEIPIDLTAVRPADRYFDAVYALAEEHKDEMFAIRGEEPISGTYMLKVKHTGEIYYEFVINEFSYVNVNAKTGEITLQHFWNGVYED